MFSLRTAAALTALLSGSALAVPTFSKNPHTRRATCTGTFTPITASTFVSGMNPGWNLGNTLDAVETEGDWGNTASAANFEDVQSAGFSGVRIPVTWAYHVGDAPDYTIDSTWMSRVSEVIDYALDRDMYALVNMHHDSWIWADVTATDANLTEIQDKFYKIWVQIGEGLGCKGPRLGFEPINEPPGTTAEHGAAINTFNELFLQAINEAGGFNADRVVTLVGAGEDGLKTTQWFEKPAGNWTNPWAIQYHYYSPYDFIFSAWGKTIWGSDADKATLDTDLSIVRGNFSDIPLLIGEWDASYTNTETAARWKYFDYLVRTAAKYDTATVLWDNGGDQLDRTAHAWRDPTVIDIYMNAVDDATVNALADSTTDASAATQWTSAYIWHQVGTEVEDQALPFIMNGNSVTGISAGGEDLVEGTDYSVAGSNITFAASWLSGYVSADASTGIKANVTVSFDAGADLILQVVQWDVPTLGSKTSVADGTVDLSIPITWAGLEKVAAVRMMTTSGVYVVDDWTQYLGPLQQARATYSSQWSWDANNVIITSGGSSAVVTAGEDTIITFEFYPRDGVSGNAVNYTLTV